MTIANIIANRSADNIIYCDAGDRVKDAVRLLAGKRIGAMPVMERGVVSGILSERDVIYRLAEEGSSCLDRTVGEIMTSPAVTVEAGTTIDDALALMTKRRFRHFPVVEDGRLIAFVSIGDMVKNKIDEIQHEAEAMRVYIQS